MRAIELETRVLVAVDQLRAGQLVEDDFIECKRDWPGEDKARQLAGSLNRASGDPVIYIVGIDEKTSDIFDTSGTDILDWWNQIVSKFDQAQPEMIRHMRISIGGNGDSVVAVAISSERAPYLIKTGLAKPRLEIPIRTATGTQTASREQLLRMLIPVVKLPKAVVLAADLKATWRAEEETDYLSPGADTVRPERIEIRGYVRIFFEHSGLGILTLPNYGMRGSVRLGSESYFLSVLPAGRLTDGEKQPQIGVIRDTEWFVITGPGAITVSVSVDDLDSKLVNDILSVEDATVSLEFYIVGSVRPLMLNLELPKNSHRRLQETDSVSELAQWSMKLSAD